MNIDHEAREAARTALEGFELHLQAGVPSRITFGRYESKQVVNAAIDAYNAKLQDGQSDLWKTVFRALDGIVEAGIDHRDATDAVIAALSAQRQDHTEPEWEYAQSEVLGDGTVAYGSPIETIEEAIRRRDLDRMNYPWPEELGVGRRIKAGPWELVEGKSDE